ncbi:DUF1985 domain-containing protein [Abeliophyllum distichum]|uniref:DUF1985 domain-containing protein n=1 Tax=Abeliophyllum distichum TaxID=126358 RepID=A0ABD1PBU6_9LAMI
MDNDDRAVHWLGGGGVREPHSCFCHLLSVAEIKISLQIVHQCIVRAVRTLKENEVWCKFGNKIARFGLEEFVLITGLKTGELESEHENLGLKSDLIQKYFKKSKGKVVRKQLLIAFRRCGNQPDKFKMGLLLILAYVLLSAEENTNLNLWWFNVVDNFERFNNYVVGAGDQENQDNVKFTPKSFFNSGSELETFSDEEFQQFMTTRDTFNPNTFDVVPM